MEHWFDNFIEYIRCGGNLELIRGEEIGRDEIELETQTVIIDTCYCADTKMYETAVLTSYDTYIIEEYRTAKRAKEGHNEWVEMAKLYKSISFMDVQDTVIRVVR